MTEGLAPRDRQVAGPATEHPEARERVYTRYETREEWLLRAADEFRPAFRPLGVPLPSTIRVSVGFPIRSRRAIGQCFQTSAAIDGVNHVFISPVLDEPAVVLHVLLHELIHVADNCESGHRGRFVRVATALGLVGPMRSTTPGPALAARLGVLSSALGPFPHRGLRSGQLDRQRRQTTRMLKVQCPACGYPARTTRVWLDRLGPPFCACGERMVRALGEAQ